MKMKYFLFALVFYPLCSVNVLAGNLEQEINTLTQRIKGAHQAADAGALKEVDQKFKILRFEDREWKGFADKQNPLIFKWSSQDERQRVGSWLFYPKEFDKTEIELNNEKKTVPWGFLDNAYQIRLTERIDYVWALTIASKYQNPIAQYHLCRVMIEALAVQEGHLTRDREGPYKHLSLSSLKNFYHQCLGSLKKDAELNQGAKDIITYLPLLRWDNFGLSLIMGLIEGKPPESEQVVHETVGSLSRLSLRSQLRSLEAKKRWVNLGRASQQDFLKFAQNYVPAYKSFIDHFDRDDDYDHEESERYLDKAITFGHWPSYIDRGLLYIRQGEYDVETGKKEEGEARIQEGKGQFEIATQKGISQGYIEQGIQLLGKSPVGLSIIEQIFFKKEDAKDAFVRVEGASNFFKQTTEILKDPQGHYLNALLAHKSYEYFEAQEKHSKSQKQHFKAQKEKFKKDYDESLEKAAKLGLTEAYCLMTKKDFDAVKQTHPPLYDGLWTKLMDYIQSDDGKAASPSERSPEHKKAKFQTKGTKKKN